MGDTRGGGWLVVIEVGRLLVQVHAKRLDTGVKLHRITTAQRVTERNAEVKLAELELEKAKSQEARKRVAEK